MKPIKYIILIAFVCVIAASCDKRMDKIASETRDFNNKALVQVIVTAAAAANSSVFIDSRIVTGNLLSAGSIFPAAATGIGFAVDPGLRAFMFSSTTATQPALTFAENLNAGQRYTIFIYDTASAVKQKTVKDDIVIPTTDSTARMRFANFVYNPTPISAVDVFSFRRQANIFTNVQVTEVTPFINIKAGISDTFYVRPTGTSVNLQNFTITAPNPAVFTDLRTFFTPTHTRSYTMVFRGSFRTANSGLTQSRALTVYSH